MTGFKKLYIVLAGILLSSAIMGQVIRNASTIYIQDGTFFVEGEYINEGSGNIEFNTSSTPLFEITGDLTNNASGQLILSAGTNGEMIFSGSGVQSIGGTSNAVFEFEDLTINIGSFVELAPGKYATLKGDLTNNGSFTLQSSGAASTASLIAEGSVNGDLDIERYMEGSRFHIISSPVSNQVISSFISTNNIDPNNANTQYAMTDYDESVNQWNGFFTVSGTPTSNMTPAKGYLAGIVTAAPVTFSGSINTGNQSIAITNTDDTLAWNAIGNPYTSSIGVDTLIKHNAAILLNSFEGFYVYNGTNYVSLTGGSLPPGQGFFVRAETGGGTFDFTSAHQVHQSAGFYKKSLVSNPYGQIKLFGSIEGAQDRAILRLYSDESTFGLDPGKDLGKFKGGVDFLVYSQLVEDNGVDFEIQALPADHIESISVPIGMYYADGGEVTFSAESLDLPAGTRLIFEDRTLEKFIDLEPASASYTVDLPAETSGYGRFYLHTFDIQAVGVELNDLSNFNIFAKDKVVYLRGLIEQTGTVTVYDLMGRMHRRVQLEPGTEHEINLQELIEGIYIIRLEDGVQFHSEKLLLK